MISRYNISVISDLWSNQARFNYFLKVEKSLCKSLEHFNKIPSGVYKSLETVTINEVRIEEIEKEVRHDVIAFCTSITDQMPQEFKAYFHYGVTSSDIIDTALMLQMKSSTVLIKDMLTSVIKSLDEQINKTNRMICVGRSHGIYAEPMIFAQKWLGHLAEFARRYNELNAFEFTAQFSGAVGNYSVLSPEIEEYAANQLGLGVEDVTTQVIPRDRITSLVSIFVNLGSAIERIAIELRHLQHSDVDEVHEGFSKKQKGSSTMPHKKNPISSENITGLARMLRSYQQVANDNAQLWHERDISHSSAERMYLPDMFGIALYALDRLNTTIQNLTYNKENIHKKIIENPKVFSSIILHKLIDHTSLSREELYTIVQEASFNNKDLRSLLDSIQNQVATHTDQVFKLPTLDELTTHYSIQFEKVYARIQKKHSHFFC